MANVVLFRAGQPPQLLLSVETSLYISDPDAIINPDLSGVSGIPLKYFKRSGNNVIVMNATEQAAVDAADIWYKLRAVVNDAGTLASFFVNGVWVGNITTNIPTTNARATGLIHKIEKSVGLTARLSYMDYFYMSKMVTR